MTWSGLWPTKFTFFLEIKVRDFIGKYQYKKSLAIHPLFKALLKKTGGVCSTDYSPDIPCHAISGLVSDCLRLGGVLDLSMVVFLNCSRLLGPASLSGLSWLSTAMKNMSLKKRATEKKPIQRRVTAKILTSALWSVIGETAFQVQ